MSRKIIKRFFTDVTITSAGNELGNIIGGAALPLGGYVQQIIFQQTSGGASSLSSIQIRYESGNSGAAYLVYSNTSATLSSNAFSDAYISAPFSLSAPNPYSDLILYAQTDVTGTFTVRVDLEIFNA